MANLPVRKMGEIGLILDQGPHDLPLNAWSGGNNVVFKGKSARRGPAFRMLQDLDATVPAPAFITSVRPASGADSIYVANTEGSVWQFTPGSGMTDVTDGDYVPAAGTSQFTSALLSGVLYINRDTHPLRYLNPSTGFVEDLPQWPSDYRASVVRSYKDFLFGLGLTKNGTEYLTTFKWSNRVLAGQIPDTWDPTIIIDNLAGETTLSALDGPIMDASELRDILAVYSPNQVWAIEFTGDRTFPFTQRRLFGDGGAIGRNCVVEVNGKHFVFGADDLYVHDGIQKTSIASGRVRDWVFRHMNRSLSSQFYVSHDRVNRAILFCFIAQDPDATFTNTEFPNRAAVFYYEDSTWGLRDLPNVPSMCNANASSVLTWSSTSETWGSIGGTWGDLEDGRKDALLSVASPTGAVTTARIHATDGIDVDSRIVAPLDLSATAPAFLERVGIDMDEVNLPLNVFKTADTIYPQVQTFRSLALLFEVGSTVLQQEEAVYEEAQEFDPTQHYTVNSTSSGRYLCLRITEPEPCDFKVTGMDINIIPNGER